MKMTPTPEQEAVIQKIVSQGSASGGALSGSDVGTGKTLIGVEVALRLWAGRVLIIAPGGTFDNWRDTLRKQGGIDLKPCANQKFAGVPVKECKANLEALLSGESGWFFLTREMFVSLDWHTKEANGQRKRSQKRIYREHPFDVAIYDEVQSVSNRQSRGYKSWLSLEAGLKLAQSADWFGNDLDNQWAIARALWPEYTESNFYSWKDQWMTTEYDHFSYDKKKTVAEKLPGAFANDLPCYVRLESTLGSTPEAEIRWVDLSPEQRKLYNKIERDMIAWIEDNPLVIELPMHLRIRLRQLTLGMFTVSADGEVDFENDCKSSKLDEAQSIINEHPGQFLILTDSQRFARVVAARIPGAVEWSGKVSQRDRDAIKERFIAGEVQHIVAVIPSIAEGVDGLQHASHNMIFLSESDNELQNRQVIGRLWRRGQERGVNIWKIAARDTYDLGQMSNLMDKALKNNMAKALHKTA